MTDIKTRLMSRERPSLVYTLQLEDSSELKERLAKAKIQLERSSKAEKDKATRRVKRLEKQIANTAVKVKFTALPRAEYEELIYTYPPTVEQVDGKSDEDVPVWNTDSFPAALIAACSDTGMTADEWQSVLDNNLNKGESQLIWATVLQLNELPKQVDSSIPKGFAATLA